MLSLIWRTPAPAWRLCVSLYVMCFLLAACGGNPRAPVEDRHPPTTHRHPVETVQSDSTYRVQRGDTLYSIAFRYGMDFRKLAAANRIAAPHTIYPGQTIVMREAALPQPVPTATPKESAAAKPSIAKAPASSTTAPSPASVPEPRSKPQKKAPAPTYSGAAVSKWLWPAEGRVTRGYSTSVHKGIDIGGKRGDPIVAVASGKVVYAGTGIVGFGELLIIKHNDVYLSAYGHNDRLLVAEGAVVAAGEKIAEKGSSGTDAVKLHFEIRKAGKPVDPQRLLPRR